MPKLPTRPTKPATKDVPKKVSLKDKIAAKKEAVKPVTKPAVKEDIPESTPRTVLEVVEGIEALVKTFVTAFLNRAQTKASAPEPGKPAAAKLSAAEPAKKVEQAASTAKMTVRGFSLDEEGVSIDPTMRDIWTEAEMLHVAKVLSMDLSEYVGKPQMMRQVLWEKLGEGEQVNPDEREPAKLADKVRTFPANIELDEDDLPVQSFIKGNPDGVFDVKHVPRSAWRMNKIKEEGVTYDFKKMHQAAFQFFTAAREQGVFDCEGRNCNDCVEASESLSMAGTCHKEFLSKDFEFEWPKGSSVFGFDQAKFLAKHEAK